MIFSGPENWKSLSSQFFSFFFFIVSSGSYSGSDVLSLLASPTSGRNNEYQSRILSFLYTQDPNPKGMNLADWPQYGSEGEMLEFNDQGVSPKPVTDSFRQDALSYYIQNLMGDGFKHD